VSKVESHWCWLSARQRVQRVGSPLSCNACKRFANRHRCGADPSPTECIRTFGVVDCNACNSALAKGEFSEGVPALDGEPRVDAPSNPDKKLDGRKMPRVRETEGIDRKDRIKRKAARHTLIVLAVSLGCNTRGAVCRALKRFHDVQGKTFDLVPRTIQMDLDALVAAGWMTKRKVMRERERPHLAPFAWHYKINPSIPSLLGVDGDDDDDDDTE
jgi:hypothetical protein